MILTAREITQTGKYLLAPNPSRCLLQTVKAYLSHLHPEVDALFQRPEEISLRFDPEKDKIWFERKVLGHKSLENMMRNMTERAGILPYPTNHSLRATTVTILSSDNNVETRQIKAVTGHGSDPSIESYCERPTLHQFKSMSSKIQGRENTPHASTSSNPITCTATQSGYSAERIFAMPTNSVSVSQNEENFLLPNGVNPQAILPLGNFQGCLFTFNTNMNK